MTSLFDLISNLSFNFPALFLGFIILTYCVLGFFIIYHLTRFGIGTKPKLLSFVFFIGSFFLLAAVVMSYSQISASPNLGDLFERYLNSFPFIR